LNVLFVDLVNWLAYAQDADGRLWLSDYPGPTAATAAPGSPRELHGDPAMLAALAELLQVLARQAPALYRHAPLAQPHLGAIARLAAALAADSSPQPALTEARHCFEWTPLPGPWGEALRSAWSRLDARAASIG
jgi:hypothetical protein